MSSFILPVDTPRRIHASSAEPVSSAYASGNGSSLPATAVLTRRCFLQGLALAAFAALSTSCASAQTGGAFSDASDSPEPKALLVAASIDAMVELARAAGGDFVRVLPMLPKGADAHAFEPSPAQLSSLARADAWVFNGFGMEAWGERLLAAVEKPDLRVIVASDGVTPLRETPHAGHDHANDERSEAAHRAEKLEKQDEHAHAHPSEHAGDHEHDHTHEIDHAAEHNSPHRSDRLKVPVPAAESPLASWLVKLGGRLREDGHSHGAVNPHVWLSPLGAAKETTAIAEAFAELDPLHADAYRENARRFAAALEAMAAEFHRNIERAPRRYFVVGHAAFGYLCRDFGLEEVSVEGIYGHGEPSPKALARLVDFSREAGIRTIFAEEAASPAVSRVLAEEVGARVATLYTMESPEGGLDFLERMRRNLKAIAASLYD